MSTDLEKDAWKASDNLGKAIDYLFKTDLKPVVRSKIIRDMLKDNLIEFHKKHTYVPGEENERKD